MNVSAPIPRDSLVSTAATMVDQAYRWLDAVPYWLLALPLRVAVAWVFWSSGMTHLANWETTLELFETEYQLPFRPARRLTWRYRSRSRRRSFSFWGC
jgi:hypothetical protein